MVVVLLVSCSGLLLQAATLSAEALRLEAIWASVCPAALCVFTTLQSTGSFEVENIEHPESPTATINSAEAVEIQSPLRPFRCMIFLPAIQIACSISPETARPQANAGLLPFVAEIRKDLLKLLVLVAIDRRNRLIDRLSDDILDAARRLIHLATILQFLVISQYADCFFDASFNFIRRSIH
jgi:hypothetical protein